MKINKSIYLIIFVAIIICFFIFLTIFDLKISFLFADLNLNNYLSTNLFAIFFEIFGEFILYLLVAFSLGIAFWYIYFNINSNLSVFFQFIFFLLIFFTFFLGFYRIIGYLNAYNLIQINWIIISVNIFFGIFFAFLTILILKFLNKSQITNLIKFAILVLFVAIASNLIVHLLKGGVFARLRFRTMFYISDFNFYAPWYSLNGNALLENLKNTGLYQDAFRSFPSGHTSAVCIVFCLFALPKMLNIKKSISLAFCKIIPTLYVLMVGFSRIVAGAHFATDVFFSMVLTAFLTYVGYIFLFTTHKAEDLHKY